MKQEYRDRITINWKSFPLTPEKVPERRYNAHSHESRLQAAENEPSISFKPWEGMEEYPKWSMPHLEAAKCAALQGEKAFERFHMALFQAYFELSCNINDRGVLIALAHESGLDVRQFVVNLDSGAQQTKVMADLVEAITQHSASQVPFVIIGSRRPIVGAAPLTVYRLALCRQIAELDQEKRERS